MKVLRNFTLHEQGEAECAIAARSGFSLSRAPDGAVVEPGEAGLARAATQLVDQFRSCAAQSEAVLVGGHTGVLLAAVLTLLAHGEVLPDLWYFDTRRIQDDKGRFVFQPECLVRIAPL